MVTRDLRQRAVVLAALAALGTPALGAIYQWNATGPTGGAWATPSNWTLVGGSGTAPPGINDTANFTLGGGGAFPVVINTDDALNMAVAFGDITLRGTGSFRRLWINNQLWVANEAHLRVGAPNAHVLMTTRSELRVDNGGEMTIRNGSRVSSSGAAASLNLATVGPGTVSRLVIDGGTLALGSGRSGNSSARLGDNGARGILLVANGSAAIEGPVDLAFSSASNSRADVGVFANSSLTTGNLWIGRSTSGSATGQHAILHVQESGAVLSLQGGASLTVGSAVNNNILAVLGVHNGGVINTGTGTTTIQRTGQLQITPGGTFNANGPVVISNGGSVSVAANSGFNLAPGRTVELSGASKLSFGGFYRLHRGSQISVRSGSTVDVTGVFDIAGGTGASGNGTLLVENAQSRVSVGASSIWGSNGNRATANVRLGGAVNIDSALALAESAVSGTRADVTLQHNGALTVGGAVRLAALGGANTAATLTVDSFGRFTQDSFLSLIIGHASSGSAVVNVQNGGTFITGTGATEVRATGQINLSTGALFHARGPINMAGGQFNFTGGTLQVGLFNGSLLQQGGTLAPGGTIAPGLATITGDYTQQTGSLHIDLAGTAPGTEHDRLVVNGTATLGGQLTISRIGGFIPQPGDSFEILSAGNIVGSFNPIVGRAVNPTTWLATIYGPTSVTIAVARPGDANLDGTVNLADFNILAANFGASGANWLMGDFTGDGLVNLADFNALAANFGLSASAGGPTPDDWSALAAAVPEPACLGLVPLVAAVSLRRRRRI